MESKVSPENRSEQSAGFKRLVTLNGKIKMLEQALDVDQRRAGLTPREDVKQMGRDLLALVRERDALAQKLHEDHERRDLEGGYYAIHENDDESVGGWWLYDDHRDFVCWCDTLADATRSAKERSS